MRPFPRYTVVSPIQYSAPSSTRPCFVQFRGYPVDRWHSALVFRTQPELCHSKSAIFLRSHDKTTAIRLCTSAACLGSGVCRCPLGPSDYWPTYVEVLQAGQSAPTSAKLIYGFAPVLMRSTALSVDVSLLTAPRTHKRERK